MANKKTKRDLRLCRDCGVDGHYWDFKTGKRSHDPPGITFTPELPCPKARNIK